MVINKKTALFFMSANIIYVAYVICQFFLLHETVFINLNAPPVSIAATSVWFVIPTILNLFIVAGLIWVLKTFGEKWWILLTFVIYFLGKLTLLIIEYVNRPETFLRFTANNIGLSAITFLMMFIGLAILFFVRSKPVRKYFRLFPVIIFISTIIPIIGDYFYDHFLQANWLLINRDVLVHLFFVATLVMFVDVYNLSGKELFPPAKTPEISETL